MTDPLAQRHIISASRRTDIPAFYSDWFLNRLEAGFCDVRNPFNQTIRQVSLRPEHCIAIVLWTRDPMLVIPHLGKRMKQGHIFYTHMTVIKYPPAIEPHGCPIQHGIEQFRRLSEIIGVHAVIWRYDPIIFSSETPHEYHVAWFKKIAQKLRDYTMICIVSFMDEYTKTRQRMNAACSNGDLRIHSPNKSEKIKLLRALVKIARENQMSLTICCEPELVDPSFNRAQCIGPDLLSRQNGLELSQFVKAPTRKGCGCYRSIDIGAYDTCIRGCKYCYAVRSQKTAHRRHESHENESSRLGI